MRAIRAAGQLPWTIWISQKPEQVAKQQAVPGAVVLDSAIHAGAPRAAQIIQTRVGSSGDSNPGGPAVRESPSATMVIVVSSAEARLTAYTRKTVAKAHPEDYNKFPEFNQQVQHLRP